MIQRPFAWLGLVLVTTAVIAAPALLGTRNGLSAATNVLQPMLASLHRDVLAHDHHPVGLRARRRLVRKLGDRFRLEPQVLKLALDDRRRLDVGAVRPRLGLYLRPRPVHQPLPRRGGQGVRLPDQIRVRVIPEDEPHALGGPAIQVPRLAEIRIAAKRDPLELHLATQRPRLIEPLGRALRQRSIAAPIHQKQRLTGVRQRHHQRVIAPHAVIGDVHPVLALARRLRQQRVRPNRFRSSRHSCATAI